MTHENETGGGESSSGSHKSHRKDSQARKFLPLRILRDLYRKPASAIGISLVLIFVILAAIGPFIAPYSPTKLSSDRREPPSVEHFFGTDNFGRDVFSRVILGSQSILTLAGLGTLIAVLLGLSFGLISGYRGGWFDEILMRAFDSLLAFPALLLALLMLSTLVFLPANFKVLLVIIIVYTPIVARVVRSEVLAIKTKGFVEASQLQGETTSFILFREILPSVLPALSVEAAMRFTYAIFLVASLGFLGVGVQPPTPDWGLMVSDSRQFARSAPWMLLYPALAISLFVVGMNLTADGLKRVLQSSSDSSAGLSNRFLRNLSKARHSERSNQASQANSLVEFRDVTISYFQKRKRLDAVRDVSLTINKGQTLGLVGESGSGKSTLAMALMKTLSPNGVVQSGSITFENHDILSLNDNELRSIWGNDMNLVPQDPLSSLNPSMKVGFQMAEALRVHQNLSKSQVRDRMIELLQSVQIADPERVEKSYPHQLSGGMQQRVMIAMALATSPQLLVLDEPTTGLDVTTESTVLELFRKLISEQNTSALYISHDLGVVRQIADRVAVLYAGELVEKAETSDLYSKPLHPYTQGLLESVPKLGESKDGVQLASMRGQIPALHSLPKGCVFEPRCPFAIEECRTTRPTLDLVDINGANRQVRCHRWQEIWNEELNTETAPRKRAKQQAVARTRTLESVFKSSKLAKHFPLGYKLMERIKGRPRPVVKAVDGISLEIQSGSTLGLVGESGSGKSTFVRTVIGLERPTSGDIEFNGKAIAKRVSKRDKDILKKLQMVFQNPQEALNPYRSIGDTLSRTLTQLGEKSKLDAAVETIHLLEQVRLDAEYVNRLPAQLSGGEKQRVAIARAFAAQPELILCDEPTSALDVSVQARILNLLTELQEREGSAYLFISHDLSVVGYIADVIAVVYLGKLMEIGQRSDFFDPPHHPYTEALLSAIPHLEVEQSEYVRLEGEIPSPTDVPTGCPFHTRCPKFLGDICVNETPKWQEAEDGQRIFCHIPLEDLRTSQKPIFNPKYGESS
jgi:peptide/nickel transport system ATP-binding protein